MDSTETAFKHWYCKFCVFYDDRDSTCKKNPPTKVALEIGFPYVDKNDFCGEWRDCKTMQKWNFGFV